MKQFRALMRTGFVNEAVLTFLGYVGVPLDAESIDTAVDAYIRSGCRGFTIRWFTNGVMHGVTLSPTTGMESFCVVIADEIGSDPDVVAARRVVTLLHEFAHFLPRYITLKRGNVVYRTPEKAVNFKDSPLAREWRREGGAMLERILFRKEVNITTAENARHVLSWNGEGQLSIPSNAPSNAPSGSSGASDSSARVSRVREWQSETPTPKAQPALAQTTGEPSSVAQSAVDSLRGQKTADIGQQTETNEPSSVPQSELEGKKICCAVL